MSTLEAALSQVNELIDANQVSQAQSLLESAVRAAARSTLEEQNARILQTVDRFLPKRKKALSLFLVEQLASKPTTDRSVREPPTSVPATIDTRAFRSRMRATLKGLSDGHIFQWSTFYRDYVAEVFPSVAGTLTERQAPELLEVIADEFTSHAKEIFEKGYRYHIGMKIGSHSTAVQKSLAGLQRFLELPVEAYATSGGASNRGTPLARRLVCSAILGGVLRGYAASSFANDSGKAVLPRLPRAWAHYALFLGQKQLAAVAEELEAGVLRDGIVETLLPVSAALDRLAAGPDPVIPILGQFFSEARRFDIGLRPANVAQNPRIVEVQVFLDSGLIGQATLDEAQHRDLAVVAAPLRADLDEWVQENQRLQLMVLNTQQLNPEEVERRFTELVKAKVTARKTSEANGPLAYNIAREFPLKNARLARFYHVYRRSIRNLLRTFERRNGVRLWCSVRRSGKTVGCLDLGASSSDSTVVTQTCANTDGREEGAELYDRVVGALTEGRDLSPDFFNTVVEASGAGRRIGQGRFVFVLDEYEYLFERLRIECDSKPELELRVALPLLNQMVAFSQSNLLVLLGQQPDAHFILMDRNQLSAYIEADRFPLFSTGPEIDGSELRALLKKVLTEQLPFDPEFEAAVASETSGHPFLTVNVLVAFVDWLIDRRATVAGKPLGREIWNAFSKERLNISGVAASDVFEFFRRAAQEALSQRGRRRTPWLYAQYWLLNQLGRQGGAMQLPVSRVIAAINSAGIQNLTGRAPLDLLKSGHHANFLEWQGDHVEPRIRILARVAAGI